MKVYLTSGHQIIKGKGNGAFGVDGFDEAYEARKFVTDVINFLTYAQKIPKSQILTDHDSWSLNAVINWIAKQATPKCLSIDVHFNSFHSHKATGTEVLVANNATSQEQSIARDFSFIISQVMRLHNRGVKTEGKSARGKLGMLSGGGHKSINILVEICFISNEADVRAYRVHYWMLVEKFSELIVKIIQEQK